MDIVNQKLGNVGDIHASIVDGKLVVGVDADVDLVAQLEKIRLAHSTGLLGEVIAAAEGGLKALTAAPAAAAPAAVKA